MTSQTAAFRRRVRDHMAPPPLTVPLDEPVAQVVAAMGRVKATAAVVTTPGGGIAGIVTEQDVVRRIACQPCDGLVAAEVMTASVLTVLDEHPLYIAIGFMRRHRLRHMPVVDANDRLVGMLALHEALAVANGLLMDDIDHLTHEDTLEGLAEVKAAQVDLAERLFEDAVPAPEIQALISDINNDIYRRVLRLLVGEMVMEGVGPPPVPFTAIVMGSGGRGESYLFPDQDNGFILADYPDERHDEIDPWFVELADRMTRVLDRLQFPLCKGNVMATNPLWRKTLPQWRQQIAGWLRKRHEAMLLFCDIFFDFRPVFGEPSLADELRDFVTDAAARHPRFLHDMFGIQADHRAGIGFLGRLVTERDDPQHKGHINLKLMGTLPLAEAVRLMALRSRVPATGTLQRIAGLQAAGVLNDSDADHLTSAFGFITGLQLRQQIRDSRAGIAVSNFVDPRSLTERELATLKDSLRAINDFRARVRADLTGQLVG